MKFPKNKDNLFLVYRINSLDLTETPIAAFRTLEGADNYAGACQQDLLDRGWTEFSFAVASLVYYDD